MSFLSAAILNVLWPWLGGWTFLDEASQEKCFQLFLGDSNRSSAGPDSIDRRKRDLRTYGIGAQILRDLGVLRMRLLAHPRRMPSMAGFDLEVTGYVQPEDRRSAG